MNGAIYAVSSIILFVVNMYFIGRAVSYYFYIEKLKEDYYDTDDHKEENKLYNKIQVAKYRLIMLVMLVVFGLYINVDSIINIWRFW